MVKRKFHAGIQYYAVVSRQDDTTTLFLIASVHVPQVSWRLYQANPTRPTWVEDVYLSNYFGPVDRWRLRPMTVAQAEAALEEWGGGLLAE
jgi:hypothetical protein